VPHPHRRVAASARHLQHVLELEPSQVLLDLPADEHVTVVDKLAHERARL
jgi:hypothetical protein